ncbi:glycoside hydrolase family 6 protein [Amycolatopsis sp. OK19-0408]|uniref:Glycoside hydrolase family 6 protein n=1 Tax=Amycolatopsis iheyensis TaxID=2945988 RepID=A0A9X2NML1_9PSEU|nr:glycoside hydrolase family 6 protein [Amycolatopsis iheyensis]MCR6490293.1 glycoside hydrolase family 6 protein [Amycolatopsis iheyensis]
MTRWLALIPVLALLAACGPYAGDKRPPSTAVSFPLLAGADDFYVDPGNPAAAWVRSAPPGPARETIATRIASRPAARLVTVPADAGPFVAAAAAAKRKPVLLADATGDCAAETYHRWFTALAAAIAGRPAVVVVRVAACPALRAAALADAVRTLRAPATATLLDVSDLGFPDDAARLLTAADVRDAAGFALNVGRYADDGRLTATAEAILSRLATSTGRTDYLPLFDTARNGAEVTGGCNPAGAKTGAWERIDRAGKPQGLWLTTPGTSDGPCGTAPGSRRGEFDPDLAIRLVPEPGH